jgi:hypothetical protein
MNLSILEAGRDDDDLGPLRRMIARLANRCELDLHDSAALKRFLEGDFSRCKTSDWDLRCCQDLHSLIILLFRLEASTSEDLGISGLYGLWNRQSQLLARIGVLETTHSPLRREIFS